MKRTFLVGFVCALIGAAKPVLAQNTVTHFELDATRSQIRLLITSSGSMQYEVLPFHSRSYTLIRIQPLRFEPAQKDSLLRSVSLHKQVGVFELLDKTIMLVLKNTRSEDISVKLSDQDNRLSVVMVRKSFDISRAETDKTKSVDEYLAKAYNLHNKGNYEEAIAAVRSALRIQPNNGRAYYLGGQIRFALKDYDKARFNFKKARSLNEEPDESLKYIEQIDRLTEITTNVEETEAVAGIPKEIPQQMAQAEKTELPFVGPNLPQHSVHRIASDTSQENTAADSLATASPNFYDEMYSESSIGSYLQLALFLIILGGLFAWGYLLKKRYWPVRPHKLKQPDFKRTFQRVRKTVPDIREPQTGRYEGNDFLAQPQKARRIDLFEDKPATAGTRAIDRTSFQRGDPTHKILYYAEKGYEIEEIAKMMGMGIGAIQLALNFAEKQDLALASFDLPQQKKANVRNERMGRLFSSGDNDRRRSVGAGALEMEMQE